jgi:hypothetical protein
MRVFQKLSNTNEFQAIKVEFNLYFHTLSPYYEDHVWSPTGVKEVLHVWFTSGSVGELLPCIERRIFTQVVYSSSCKRNWNSYSFVCNKARNRLHSSCVEDLVYMYTNSRVLNQNVMFTNKAVTKWTVWSPTM